MKNILKYISVLSAAFMTVACTADFDKVVYDPANATPAELTELESSYVLIAEDEKEVAIAFEWSEPDFGYSAAATNNLEFDVEGKEFASAVTLTSINLGGKYEITTKDLNSQIMGLLANYDMEVAEASFEFRVVSTIAESVAPLYSNVVKSTITPYEGERVYPLIYLVGDYNGWSHAVNQYLYSVDDNGIYSGFVAFDSKAANGWKITGDASWNNGNWGFESDDAYTAEQTPVTLYDDGGSKNIAIYSKDYYDVTFNTETLELTVNASYDTWGVVGQFNSWGGSEDAPILDTPFTLATEVNSAGATEYYLTATVDLVANDGWKIRPNNAWGGDRGPGSFTGGEPAGADGNFYVEESGKYAIRWFFNKVDQRLEAVKLKSSTPATINALDASYTLTEEGAEESALTLSWSAADLATSETITNKIEMDVKGKEFAKAYVLGTTEENEFSWTQQELNEAVTNLLTSYEMDVVETELEFRVYSSSSDAASVPTYSEAVSTKIIPYVKVLAGDDAANDEGYTGPDNSAYTSVIVVGDYNGWSLTEPQNLYSANADDIFTGMIYFNDKAANGWKIFNEASWDYGWGLSGSDDSAEAESCVLTSDGGANIGIYSGNSYSVSFDKTTTTLTMSNSHSSWGVVGANNNWGNDGIADTAMELAYRDGQYYLHATLEFKAGDEWKIRPDNDWPNEVNTNIVAVDDKFNAGGNFKIPEDGLYTIRWYFNAVSPAVRVIKHE